MDDEIMKTNAPLLCCVETCKNNSCTEEDIFLFPIPERPDHRWSKWLRACGRIDILKESCFLINTNEKYFVCNLHFEDKMFMDNEKEKLFADAIPSVFHVSKNSDKEDTDYDSEETCSTSDIGEEAPPPDSQYPLLLNVLKNVSHKLKKGDDENSIAENKNKGCKPVSLEDQLKTTSCTQITIRDADSTSPYSDLSNPYSPLDTPKNVSNYPTITREQLAHVLSSCQDNLGNATLVNDKQQTSSDSEVENINQNGNEKMATKASIQSSIRNDLFHTGGVTYIKQDADSSISNCDDECCKNECGEDIKDMADDYTLEYYTNAGEGTSYDYYELEPGICSIPIMDETVEFSRPKLPNFIGPDSYSSSARTTIQLDFYPSNKKKSLALQSASSNNQSLISREELSKVLLACQEKIKKPSHDSFYEFEPKRKISRTENDEIDVISIDKETFNNI